MQELEECIRGRAIVEERVKQSECRVNESQAALSGTQQVLLVSHYVNVFDFWPLP